MQLLDIMIIPAESEMLQKGSFSVFREKVVYSLAARDFFHQTKLDVKLELATHKREVSSQN